MGKCRVYCYVRYTDIHSDIFIDIYIDIATDINTLHLG